MRERGREMVQFILLSVVTTRQTRTPEGVFVSVMCENTSVHCLERLHTTVHAVNNVVHFLLRLSLYRFGSVFRLSSTLFPDAEVAVFCHGACFDESLLDTPPHLTHVTQRTRVTQVTKSFQQNSSDKPTVRCLPCTKQLTDNVSD